MAAIDNILKKLNIIDQFALRKYISTEIATANLRMSGSMRTELDRATIEKENNIIDLNNKTWDTINDKLLIAMREYHISPQRIDLINFRLMKLLELDKDHINYIGSLETDEGPYEVFTKDDCSDLCGVLFDTKCKGCRTNHLDCSFYYILHKHNVPALAANCYKCRYAY